MDEFIVEGNSHGGSITMKGNWYDTEPFICDCCNCMFRDKCKNVRPWCYSPKDYKITWETVTVGGK
jgi:hypothetical protein